MRKGPSETNKKEPIWRRNWSIYSLRGKGKRECQIPKKGYSEPSKALEIPRIEEQRGVLRKPRL